MARVFNSKDMPFSEALRRYLPGRAAQRAAQRPVLRADASKKLLTPWPFCSWREFARAKEIEQRRRKVALMRWKAGLL